MSAVYYQQLFILMNPIDISKLDNIFIRNFHLYYFMFYLTCLIVRHTFCVIKQTLISFVCYKSFRTVTNSGPINHYFVNKYESAQET